MANITFNDLWYGFVDWFIELPPFIQIIVVLGIIALIAFLLTIVYYILKEIAYLIYYICKGIYYLIKGAIVGTYLIVKGIYYLITGKEKPVKEESAPLLKEPIKITPVGNALKIEAQLKPESPTIKYCNECGCQLTNSMLEQLQENGAAFCLHCGTRVDSAEYITTVSSIF